MGLIGRLAVVPLLWVGLALDVSAQSSDEIANRLLVDALTAELSPLTQRRLLSAVVEEYPDSGAARSITAGVVNLQDLPEDPAWQHLLVEDSVLTGHAHGAYPSYGERTHPGIDIGLPGDVDCGLPVVAPRTGTVRRIVAHDVPAEELNATGITPDRNTRDLEQNTGNAVVLRHDDVEPPDYSIYLHLRDSPADADGSPWRVGATIRAGQQIGLIGETGNADGCHLHFEARRFEGTYRYLHPTYGNIYPSGNISRTATFQEDWIAPAAFLRQSFIAQHLSGATEAEDRPEQVPVEGLPEPELPGTHANSTPQTMNAGGIAVAEAAEPALGESERAEVDPGDWIETREPRRRLAAGDEGGDLAMASDGSATYRGQQLFPSATGGDAFELQVFFAPDARHALVLQWNMDLGGVRAALIDLEERRIIRNDLIPETSVHGRVAAQQVRIAMMPVAWSPDGRYVGFPLSAAEWQADPFLVDTETGASVMMLTDDLQQGQWTFPQFETLRSDGADWIELDYDVLACADADCTRPEVVGSIGGGHRITALLSSASTSDGDTSTPSRPETWGPGLVADAEIGYYPCRDTARETPQCLRDLGLSDEAIAFSFARDGDYSGSTVGSEFLELGEVDLAVSQFIGNTVYYTPMLVNGPVGFTEIGFTRNLGQTFRDATSQRMLRQFSRAINIGGLSIRSHRRLADGTQRFTLMEGVMDGCRACEILGSAVSFLEIGPATGNRLVRTPVGLLLSDPDEIGDMTARVIQTRPESLQVMLNSLGYDAGEMDGLPGPQTRNALMTFQVEHCLAPTGQPDDATAAALMNASGFETPCAGTRPPEGIAANTPLLSGIYVDDPAYCTSGEVPYETAHLQQRIVRGETITFGVEGGCTAARTDIRDGVTLFRGTCSEANQTNDFRWRFDVLSNESFVDLDMPTAIPRDATPRRFSRCADDSPLRVAYRAWFGDTTARTVTASSNLPFEEGIYTTDPRICPPGDAGFVASLGQAAGTHRIDFRDGRFTQSGQTCPVTGIEGAEPNVTLVMDCLYGETRVSYQFPLQLNGTNRFIRNGLQFERCTGDGFPLADQIGQMANSTVSSLPADEASAAEAPDLPDFRAIVDGLDYVGAADKAATTELLQTVFTLLADMEPDGTAELLGISASDFAAEFVIDPEAMLAVVGADIVISAGEAAFAEAAGDIVAGYMFASGPLSRLPDEWQSPLRALVDATIVESVGLLATGTNPTPAALVGPIVDRLHDVHEIYEATNALSRTQASGLFAVANGAEILAELMREHPGHRSQALFNDWFAMTRTNLVDIVGADDANAAYSVTVLGYRALDALGRGDRTAADAEVAQMIAVGAAEQGLTPLSAEGPIDLLVRIASGGNDAPNVLVETFLKSTALRDIHPDVTEAQEAPSEDVAVATGWIGQPEVAAALRDIVSEYAPRSIGGCARAHGPLSVEYRRRLFEDATMTFVDQRGRVAERPVTQQLIEGDRFCLHPNHAQCAASNFQLYYCSSDEMLFVNPGGAFSGSFNVTAVTERRRNPLVIGRYTAIIYGRDQRDIFSEGARCALSNGWSEATGFRWDGECRNGRATGPGTILWLRGPEVIWRTRVGTQWGIMLEDGVLRFDIDLDALDVRLANCSHWISGSRATDITVPAGTPRAFFENSWVSNELMRRGALFAQSECPLDPNGFQSIVVRVLSGGEQILRGRNYDNNALTWREFSNPVERSMMTELQNAERTRQANERQRAAQARADALANEFRQRRAGLVSRAERFIETGRGTMEDLAAALEVDHIGTLDRLERGATLSLGPVEGLATVNHDGQRHYQVNYTTTSPFQRLESEFRSRQDFSWENWMAMTQSGLPSRTEVSCLFNRIARVPQQVRDIRTELVSFARGSSATRITFVCN